MSLHVLAYNMKRVLSIAKIETLMYLAPPPSSISPSALSVFHVGRGFKLVARGTWRSFRSPSSGD
jgi:hypothetical protein